MIGNPLAGGEDFRLDRRHFMKLMALAAAGSLFGCATNPVTGQSQLMLVSEENEIQIDKQNAPHQFSADYGIIQDPALSRYVQELGSDMVPHTHRQHMPYDFNVLNANYINAYTFPAGTMATTRGILLKLDNEAELAALLGHELGHVNARHTAQQMSKGMLTQSVVGGLAAVAGTQGRLYGDLAASLGMLGSGALLASYSRDNERQADSLGMQYMVASGYGTGGFIGLMEMLNNTSKHRLSAAQLLFATHPMSDERLNTAVKEAESKYKSARSLPLNRDRYMDKTAKLRAQRDAVELLQKGEAQMGQKKLAQAESTFREALKKAPRDYSGLLLLSTSLIAQQKTAQTRGYLNAAKQIYPTEAKVYHLSGYSNLVTKKFSQAHRDFSKYEELLPGNPTTLFFRGYASEQMQRREDAANDYYRYLQAVQQGDMAQYAYQRLSAWGYVK
jgi:predicted Zn-dependent protease